MWSVAVTVINLVSAHRIKSFAYRKSPLVEIQLQSYILQISDLMFIDLFISLHDRFVSSLLVKLLQ